jgi:hypothetical protein
MATDKDMQKAGQSCVNGNCVWDRKYEDGRYYWELNESLTTCCKQGGDTTQPRCTCEWVCYSPDASPDPDIDLGFETEQVQLECQPASSGIDGMLLRGGDSPKFPIVSINFGVPKIEKVSTPVGKPQKYRLNGDWDFRRAIRLQTGKTPFQRISAGNFWHISAHLIEASVGGNALILPQLQPKVDLVLEEAGAPLLLRYTLKESADAPLKEKAYWLLSSDMNVIDDQSYVVFIVDNIFVQITRPLIS